MQFQQKQLLSEINGLKQYLSSVNKQIFNGKDLEQGRIRLQERLDQAKDQNRFFFSDSDRDWVCIEGKPYKSFLHLEDIKRSVTLESLYKSDGSETKENDEILEILHDLYKNLYAHSESSPSQDEINEFLSSTPSIPKVLGTTLTLTLPISTMEVENAIKR